MDSSILYVLQKKDNLIRIKHQFEAHRIDLNTQHANGMTHFDFAVMVEIGNSTCLVIRYCRLFCSLGSCSNCLEAISG